MRHWDDLRIFVAVARAGRIAPAARQLGIDASTVTRRLARLGAAVGTPLFDRIGGIRRLSEAGETLLTLAETMEAAVLGAGDAAASGVAGHVRISLAEGLATHVVAAAIGPFRAQHPGLRIDLVTASGFLDPSRREADIALMLARPRSRQLRSQPVADYRLQLYASAEYLDRTGTPRVARDLEDHVLIGYVPEQVAAPELDYLPDIHDGLIADLRSTSINVQHAMIRSGAGIGILPRFVARDDDSLVPVLTDSVTLSRQFWLVTHRDTDAAPRIAAVAAWLRLLAARLP